MKDPKREGSFLLSSWGILVLTASILVVCGACTEEQNGADSKETASQTRERRPAQKESSDASQIPPQQFVRAALKGRRKVVRRAIEQGTDVNATNRQGKTPLMVSAFNGHLEIVRLLLKNGAQVDMTDPQGRTALMFASTGSFPETVELLLDRGANPNTTDQGEGWTPLMFAAAEGNREVVQVLLSHGADPSLSDRDGDTALTFAQNGNHEAVVELLQQ